MGIVDCQGNLADGNIKDATFICNHFLNYMGEIDPGKKLTNIFLFDGASNMKLGWKLLKLHYPKLTVMCDVEHTVSLFFNYVSNIPIVNQNIYAHKIRAGW